VIPRRLLLACILVVAFGASATVTLVSGFLAALAALEPWAGVPGALALIALAITVCLSLAVILIAPRPSRRHGIADKGSAPELLPRLWSRMKARPFLTSGLGALGLLLAVINPRYLGAILRAYLGEEKRVR